MDVDEAAGELPVILDQPVTNTEDIHVTAPLRRTTLLRVTLPYNIRKPPHGPATVRVSYFDRATLHTADSGRSHANRTRLSDSAPIARPWIGAPGTPMRRTTATCASRAGHESYLLLPFRDMGLIDVRRFSVTTFVDSKGELAVSDVELAEEDEWEINLAQVVEVNALCVPAKVADLPSYEKRTALAGELPAGRAGARFLSGTGVQGERGSRQAVCKRVVWHGHAHRGCGTLLPLEPERQRSRELRYPPRQVLRRLPCIWVRPDLLFDFTSQGDEKRLAGEARGRSERRPRGTNRDQRERLDQIVAWSGRNEFHPVTMTWAYSGAEKVQVDFFDIQDYPEELFKARESVAYQEEDLGLSSVRPVDIPVPVLRQRSQGRTAAIADELYETAPQPAPGRARQIFGRNVRGEWTTADLVAPSNLRLFLGVLDQALDRRQAGATRRAGNASFQARDADPSRSL